MNKRYFIVTGTSRGIGEQLARSLVENGDIVYGIARGVPIDLEKHANYNHVKFDLSHIWEIEHLVNDIISQMQSENTEMIGLINNAAMLEPLRGIDQCTAEEINNHVQVNLIAPMILSACFIQYTAAIPVRRKIVNISSGLGTYPAPAMSMYCTAKAGINMFTRCVGAEQVNQLNPVEMIAVDPGMVETDMQKIARGKDDSDFEMAKYFKQAHRDGQLQSTQYIANCLLKMINEQYEPGTITSH